MRPAADREDNERDESPGVFVPTLHGYFKASRLLALGRFRDVNVLQCDERCCGANGLPKIAELSETDVRAARDIASQHNMVSAELAARRILSAAEPRDAWWEACKAGADTAASLVANGISWPTSRWLRQWLEIGSPSHEPQVVG
jgi:hypothetical protein